MSLINSKILFILINLKNKNMKDYKNHVVKYTVELNNLKEGTITAVELPEIKIGDFEKNVQFVDEFGNRMGKDGTVVEIKKIELIA